MAKRQLRGAELKDFRHKVARLKSMGLVSKRVDARKQKSTRYMRDIVEKTFAPVLQGKAVAVKLPSHKVAKEYASDAFSVRGKKVVVPIEKGAQRPHWSPKQKLIIGKHDKYGNEFKQIYAPLEKARSIKGKNLRFSMRFAHGMTLSRSSMAELDEMMQPYEFPREGSKRRPFSDWRKYVTIEEVDDGSGDYDEDSDI